jgi:HK97 family phage major capsid protein
MNHLDELRAKRARLIDEIQALSDRADLSLEEDAKLARLMDAYEGTEVAFADAWAARDARAAEIRRTSTARSGHTGPTFVRHTEDRDIWSAPTSNGDVTSRALHALERAAQRHGTEPRPTVEGHIREDVAFARRSIATSDPAYVPAFGKLIAKGAEAALILTDDERRAVAAVAAETEERAASTTNTAGGYAIPQLLDPTVVLTNDGVVDPIRSISRVVTGTSNVWTGINSAGVTASWDGEGVEVSDDAPTLGQPTITAYKGAAWIPFSIEIGMDWVGLAEEAVRLFADAKMRLEGAAFATGSGSQPKGIVTALDATTYAEVLPTTDGSFGIEDIYKVFNALPPRFRPNASWIMSLSAFNRVRNFSTSSPGTFTVDLTQGYKFAILGRPAFECSGMADITTLTTGASNLLVVGDFRNYVIFDRIGASMELVPHLFSTGNGRPTGQRGWYGYFRTGADLVTSSTNPAARLLQNQ